MTDSRVSPEGPASRDQLASLQILRAIAALSVAVGHSQSEAISLAAANGRVFSPVLLDLTGAGVDLFFLISGFVMVYASRGLFERPMGSLMFLSRRIARIVPLYWAMTAFFLGVMFAAPALISSPRPGAGEILGSLFFVPYFRADEGVMMPVYRLGWTLNYEMFFYVAFACVLGLPIRRALTALTACFAALVLAGLAIHPAPGPFAFWSNPIILEFAMGMWLAYLRLANVRMPAVFAAGLALTGLAAFAPQIALGLDAHGALRPLVWGLPAGAIVAAAVLCDQPMDGRGGWLPLVFLGDASYALYLSHPMVLRALRPLWVKLGAGAHVGDIWFALAALAIIPAVATAIYLGFENPITKTLQSRLKAFWAAAPAALPESAAGARTMI